MHSEESLSAVRFSTNSVTSCLGLGPVSAVTTQQITTSDTERQSGTFYLVVTIRILLDFTDHNLN